MGLFGNSRELQFGTCKPKTSPKRQSEGKLFLSFRGNLGRVALNKVHWRRTSVQGCGSFSLAAGMVSVLLSGQGGPFLPFLKSRR